MDAGTYAASSAGLLQIRKLDIVNNNLANINTPGFKREILVGEEQSFEQTLASEVAKNDPYAKGDHDRVSGTVNLKSVTDFSQGPIKNTGNSLDVALRNAKDFFVVSTPEGDQYTRAGNFTLGADGTVVTMDGYQVSGDGGPITANGPGVEITPDGGVRANRTPVGRLKVVHFEDPSVLERAGGNRFKIKAGQAGGTDVEPSIEPKALEMSNVSAISSVIELISANRAFDMYTKSARNIDEMNMSAINAVGRDR